MHVHDLDPTGRSPARLTAQDGLAAVSIWGCWRQPHADFTAAVWALLATLFGLLKTYSAGALRRHLKKTDRAAQAAAQPVGVQGGTASIGAVGRSGMGDRANVQQLSAEQRGGVRRAR